MTDLTDALASDDEPVPAWAEAAVAADSLSDARRRRPGE